MKVEEKYPQIFFDGKIEPICLSQVIAELKSFLNETDYNIIKMIEDKWDKTEDEYINLVEQRCKARKEIKELEKLQC